MLCRLVLSLEDTEVRSWNVTSPLAVVYQMATETPYSIAIASKTIVHEDIPIISNDVNQLTVEVLQGNKKS